MCQTVSIVSGNGLLPFQHQAISSVPEPCWLKINWTLRNNPVKFISPCYLINLFITVHKIWIELNWNWKKMNWIGIELKDSELELNWIEKSWIQLELELNWIERNELIRALHASYIVPGLPFSKCWAQALMYGTCIFINHGQCPVIS